MTRLVAKRWSALHSRFENVWYGTPELWTILDRNGAVWRDLPVGKGLHAVGDKTLWFALERFNERYLINKYGQGQSHYRLLPTQIDRETFFTCIDPLRQ